MCYITGWQIRSKDGLTMYRKEHNNKENLQMYDKENLQMYDKENLQMYDKENLQMYDKEKGQKNKQ